MKKIILLFAILTTNLTLLNLNCDAQWTQIATKTKSDLRCIDVINNNIYLGGDSLLKSTDGGTTWTNYPWSIYSTLYDIYFSDANTGVSTGMVSIGNDEAILRTTNGGQLWNIVHDDQSVPWPMVLNSFSFPSASIGYAVGNSGRILNTQDGGLTWNTQYANTTIELMSVFFTSTTLGFAVGYDTILKTTNGGSTWNITHVNGALTSVHFCNSTTGFASGYGVILKTTDSGNTWNIVNTPFSNTGAIYSVNKDTIIVAADNSLFISRDGGLYWEDFKSISNKKVNKIFFDGTDGYLACDTGRLFKTTNLGGYSYPITDFSVNKNYICLDTLISFNNNSDPSYTFTWKLNGHFLSNTYNTSFTFTNPSQYDTITLISYNGHYYDSLTKIIYVQSSLNFSLNTTQDKDTICSGTSANISVLNSETGVSYQLRSGTTNIGTAQNGNGGTLIFNTGNITSTSTFNILATITNVCGSQQKTNYHTVVVFSPNKNLTVTALKPVICYGDSTFVIVALSEIGVSYQLKIGSTNVKVPINGNGSDIYLPTGKITLNTTFSVFASNKFGCSGTLNQSQQITIRIFTVAFTPTLYGAFVSDTITLNNNSTADNYIWIFDSTASKAIDSSKTPHGIYYNTVGEKQIELEGTTIEGCRDTSYFTIFVCTHPAKSNGSYCFFDTITQTSYPYYWQGHILDYHVDIHGNSYIGGCIHNSYGIDGKECSFLKKFNSTGNLVWEKIQDPLSYSDSYYNYQSSFITGIETDNKMNVYITGSYASTQFEIDNIGITQSQVYPQFYIAKLDSNGKCQWIIHSNSSGTKPTGGTDILYINSNEILISLYRPSSAVFPDGSTHSLSGDIAVLEIDSNGNYIKYFPTGYCGGQVNNISFLNPSNSYWYDSRIATVSPKLKLSNNGNVYMFGKFVNYLIFGTTQINQISSSYYNSYAAILDIGTGNGWQNAFVLYGRSSGYQAGSGPTDPGIFPVYSLDENNNIYMSEYCGLDDLYDTVSVQFNNGVVVRGANNGMIAKFDNSGNLLWYNKTLCIGIRGIEHYLSNETIFYGEYKNFLGVKSQNGNIFGIPSNGDKDLAMISIDNSGNVNWADNLGSLGADIALFSNKSQCGELYFLGNLQDTTITNYDTLNYIGDNLFILHFSPAGKCINACNSIVTSDFGYPMYMNTILVYPNPANDKIEVSSQQSAVNSIEIYDMLGEKVFTTTNHKPPASPEMQDGQTTNKIDISSLPSGVYIVEVKTENGVSVKKFIKE